MASGMTEGRGALRRTARSLTLPTLLFGVAAVLSRVLGFRYLFYTDHWHLLSPDLLAHDAARSLVLLHSQPPLLNLTAALIYKFSALISVPPARVAEFFFMLLGWGTTCLLFDLVQRIRSSKFLSIAAVVLLLTDPAFWFYQNTFFYSMMLLFLFTASSWFLHRFLRTETVGSFSGFAFSTVLTTLLRSLYAPIWAVITMAAALLSRFSRRTARPRGRSSPAWTVLAAALLLLFAWPVKNLVVFGQFTFTSWTCYNLRAGRSEQRRELRSYLRNGVVAEHVTAELEAFKRKHGIAAAPAIENVTKADGSRNWNHYIFLVENRGAWTRAWKYASSRPMRFLSESSANYWRWSAPTYRDSYTNANEGPESAAYQDYAALHRRIFFGGWGRRAVGRIFALRTHGGRLLRAGSAFGAVIVPLLLVGLGWRVWKGSPVGWEWERSYIAILLFWVSWNLIVPAISDGVEASRMRFPMTTVLIVLGALVLPLSGRAKSDSRG